MHAARLLAEDRLTDRRIAEEIGVPAGTLSDWKRDPAFVAYVDELIRDIESQAMQILYAKKRDRIQALSDVAQRLLSIADERAAAAMLDPETRNIPGMKSGFMRRELKTAGSGANTHRWLVYIPDTALSGEIRATLQQIAIERGEWSEKPDKTAGASVTPLPIQRVEFALPLAAEGTNDDD